MPVSLQCHAVALAMVVAGSSIAGCGGSSDRPIDAGATPDAHGVSTPEDGGAPPSSDDGGSTPPTTDDAGGPSPGEDAGPPAPRNATCTPESAQSGTAIDTAHGRLDGTLVYVLPVGGSYACNGDDSHVHLQIEVSGSVYDVAVDIGSTGDDVGLYEETIAVPSGAWSEGWHGADTLAYPTLGLSASEFPIGTPTSIASQVEAALVSTSKISIFCTGYSQDNGCHDVHYENGSGNDGAIVLDPTAATSPVLFFRFEGQTF